MDKYYIQSHTPREIAKENSLEEIERWASTIPSEFNGDNGTDIFKWHSVNELADSFMDFYECMVIVTNEYGYGDDAPDADDLLLAFQILTAKHLKTE